MFAPYKDASRNADQEEEGPGEWQGPHHEGSLQVQKLAVLPLSAALAGEHRLFLWEPSVGRRSWDQGSNISGAEPAGESGRRVLRPQG